MRIKAAGYIGSSNHGNAPCSEPQMYPPCLAMPILCFCQLKTGPHIRSKNGPLFKPFFSFTNPVTVTTHVNDMGFMCKSIDQCPC